MLQKIRYRLVFNRSGRLNSRGEGLIQIECAQALRKIYFSTHTPTCALKDLSAAKWWVIVQIV